MSPNPHHAPTRGADALAPAGAGDIWRTLMSLPSAPGKGFFAAVAGVLTVTVAFNTLGSTVLGRVVDIVGGMTVPVFGSGDAALKAALAFLLFAFVADAVGPRVANYFLDTQTRRWAVDLRAKALDTVLAAPVPAVMELGTGNVITRMSKDIDTPVTIMSMIGARLFMTLFMIPISAAMMALIHPAYLLIFALAGLLVVPQIKRTLQDLPPVANMVSSVEAKRNTVLLDTIRSMETLRQFKLGAWAHARMERHSWNTVQAWADKTPVIARIVGQGQLVYGVLLIGALALSVPMIQAGWITPGQASAAVLLVVRLEIHVFNLLMFGGDIQHALTSLGRAVALTRLATDTAEEAPDLRQRQPDVVIEDLSYCYPGGAEVLHGIDLTLAGGTTTALVGTSGAGKSTLASLVAGLQYPTHGRILVGGVDTATVPNTWVTRHVALVTQEVHLFSGTLRDDLLLAAPGANDPQLHAALAAVGLTPESATWQRWLPDGLDTLIGAGHEDIGADVAQQISLARMVLRQPPVLIMDEATSEAGSEHADTLDSAARAVARGRTSLVVAHRLDQAREADRIIVMEQGQIVEDGDHAGLIAAGGRYARAYAQWEKGQTA